MRTLLALSLLVAIAAGDFVVLRDKTILEGEATAAGEMLKIGGKSIPMADVLVWESGEGVVKNQPSFRDQVRAYDALNDRAMLKRCSELLPEAIAAKQGGSARELLAAAERLGMEPDEIDKFATQVDGLGDESDAKFALGEKKAFALRRMLSESPLP